MLVPLVLAIGAALWMGAVRLGPATPTPQTSETDAVDYASWLRVCISRPAPARLRGRWRAVSSAP